MRSCLLNTGNFFVAFFSNSLLFSSPPSNSIEEGVEILTGIKAGMKLPDGSYEDDSVYSRVDKRLQEMAEILKQYPGYI